MLLDCFYSDSYLMCLEVNNHCPGCVGTVSVKGVPKVQDEHERVTQAYGCEPHPCTSDRYKQYITPSCWSGNQQGATARIFCCDAVLQLANQHAQLVQTETLTKLDQAGHTAAVYHCTTQGTVDGHIELQITAIWNHRHGQLIQMSILAIFDAASSSHNNQESLGAVLQAL